MTDKPKTKEDELREVAHKRLDELGVERVKLIHDGAGFPNEWNQFVHEWLSEDTPKGATVHGMKAKAE